MSEVRNERKELVSPPCSVTVAATPSDRLIVGSDCIEVNSESLYDAVCKWTDLKPSGKQFKGLSPFTMEKTPSFFMHPTKLGGCWKCFSTGEGGRGVDDFLEKVGRFGFDRRTGRARSKMLN